MQIRLFYLMVLTVSCGLISCNKTYQRETKYIDLVIKGEKLYALTANGHIYIFNTNTESAIDTNVHADNTITAIGIDKTNKIIVAKADLKIGSYDDQAKTFKNSFSIKDPIYNIIFDNINNEYLITANGIADISNKETYFPDSSFHYANNFWPKPSAVLADKDNNIWIGWARGEWGGKLCVFNTKTAKFSKPILGNINPVNGIFSDGNDVYISFGLAHFDINGSILKFKKNAPITVFDSKSYSTNLKGNRKTIEGEFIGPSVYNKKNNSIYFYSQNGLFKGNKEKDLTQIDNWTHIAKPKLQWTKIGSHAMGPAMNVLKMQFANNGKLFLLTQNDGIAVYDEKGFRFLN